MILAAFLAPGSTAVLGFVAVLLLAGDKLTGAIRRRATGRLLWRVRWLLASILLTYLLFTPGTPLLDASWGLPSVEGAIEGLQRVCALALLIIATDRLIGAIPRDELVAVLCRLMRHSHGAWGERLAVRLALTLEAVPLLEQSLDRQLAQAPARDGRPLELSRRLASLLSAMLRDAEDAPLIRIELHELATPPLLQWAYPVALLGSLVVLQFGW